MRWYSVLDEWQDNGDGATEWDDAVHVANALDSNVIIDDMNHVYYRVGSNWVEF